MNNIGGFRKFFFILVSIFYTLQWTVAPKYLRMSTSELRGNEDILMYLFTAFPTDVIVSSWLDMLFFIFPLSLRMIYKRDKYFYYRWYLFIVIFFSTLFSSYGFYTKYKDHDSTGTKNIFRDYIKEDNFLTYINTASVCYVKYKSGLMPKEREWYDDKFNPYPVLIPLRLSIMSIILLILVFSLAIERLWKKRFTN